MEEIKVGEYGRTNFGRIIKFAWLEQEPGKRYEYKVLLIKNNKVTNDFYYFDQFEKIVKHSPNIKDILETGDIIEHKIYQEIFKSEIYITNNDEIFTTDGERILPEEIISVVTHEMFNQVKYEV